MSDKSKVTQSPRLVAYLPKERKTEDSNSENPSVVSPYPSQNLVLLVCLQRVHAGDVDPLAKSDVPVAEPYQSEEWSCTF